MNTLSSQSILFSLLDKNREFALNARGTTNHCPMALSALAKMGASDQQLQNFYDFWSQKFCLPRDQNGCHGGIQGWKASLGRREDFHALQGYFQAEIEVCSVQKVLIDVLDASVFAPATGAFHALIRLSYGLEVGHKGEVAAGLAFLVCANLVLAQPQVVPPKSDLPDTQSVAQRFSLFHRQFRDVNFEADSITTRLQLVANDRIFWQTHTQMGELGNTQSLIDDMAVVAIRLYIQTKNFTVLHMVTGVAALRVLLNSEPTLNQTRIIESFWLAFCAAYVSVGAPALLEDEGVMGVSEHKSEGESAWLKYMELARGSKDDHVIKLTYTCWSEDRQRRLPYYLQAMAVLHGQ